MERERERVHLDVPPLRVRHQDARRAPTSPSPQITHPASPHSRVSTHILPSRGTRHERTHRSVAIWSFAIALRSSWLVAADMLVSGVLVALPLTEPVGVVPVGVDVLVEASVSLPALFFADCFAAFSASRFCFDAEGAISISPVVR